MFYDDSVCDISNILFCFLFIIVTLSLCIFSVTFLITDTKTIKLDDVKITDSKVTAFEVANDGGKKFIEIPIKEITKIYDNDKYSSEPYLKVKYRFYGLYIEYQYLYIDLGRYK